MNQITRKLLAVVCVLALIIPCAVSACARQKTQTYRFPQNRTMKITGSPSRYLFVTKSGWLQIKLPHNCRLEYQDQHGNYGKLMVDKRGIHEKTSGKYGLVRLAVHDNYDTIQISPWPTKDYKKNISSLVLRNTQTNRILCSVQIQTKQS